MAKNARQGSKEAEETKKKKAPENQSYLLDQEVPLTGEQWRTLWVMANNIKEAMLQMPKVCIRNEKNEKGEVVEARHPVYSEYLPQVEGITYFLSDIHKKNVEKGITVDSDVARKEVEELRKKQK